MAKEVKNGRPAQVDQARDKTDGARLFWEDLAGLNQIEVCNHCLAALEAPGRLTVPFFGNDLRVDLDRRKLEFPGNGGLGLAGDPLLELMTLAYLCNTGAVGLSNEMVGVKDLKEAHFFQGPHALPLEPILARFGQDPNRFKRAAAGLNGQRLDLADLAFAFNPYPKIPIYGLLWEGDEEFPPEFKVLFDRSIEHHLQADAIWGIVHLVSKALLWVDGR